MANLDLDAKLPASVEKKEFSVPPIGEYDFIVVSTELTYSKAGNPMYKVRLALSGVDGYVFDNLVLTEEAEWRLVSFFESIGLKKKNKPLDIGLRDAFDKAADKEGRVKIKHDTYNGKTTAKVDSYIVTASKKAAKKPEVELDESDLPFEI